MRDDPVAGTAPHSNLRSTLRYGVTEIAPLVASRMYLPLPRKRTSYVPAVVGAGILNVALATPVDGGVDVPFRNQIPEYVVSLLPTGAIVIQSYLFAGPSATDTVIDAPSPTESAPVEPFTVSVGPATATTVNTTADDVPPPGDGVTTVMLRDPAVDTSDDGIDALSVVLDANEVERATPFTWICELAVKPLPVTVSTNALLAFTEDGEMLSRTGTGAGVGGGGGAPTVIGPLVARRMYLPLPRNRTSYVPAVDGAGMLNVALATPVDGGVDVPFRNQIPEYVVSLLPTGAIVIQSYLLAGPLATETVSVAPSATESAPVDPLTVRVGPAPATTVNATADEVPPPGAGVTTVMLREPAVATSPEEIEVVNVVLDTNVVARDTPLN